MGTSHRLPVLSIKNCSRIPLVQHPLNRNSKALSISEIVWEEERMGEGGLGFDETKILPDAEHRVPSHEVQAST